MPAKTHLHDLPSAWEIAVWLCQNGTLQGKTYRANAASLIAAHPPLMALSAKKFAETMTGYASQNLFKLSCDRATLISAPAIALRTLIRPRLDPEAVQAPLTWQRFPASTSIALKNDEGLHEELADFPFFEGDVALGIDRPPKINKRPPSGKAPMKIYPQFEPLYLVSRTQSTVVAFAVPTKTRAAQCLIVQGRKQWQVPLVQAEKLSRGDFLRQALIRVRLQPLKGLIHGVTAVFEQLINDPDPESISAIQEFNLPHHFSDKAIHACKNLSIPQITAHDALSRNAFEAVPRLDWRDLPFVTIDGEDAKDFDDAVWAQTHADHTCTLTVAIADVAYFVRSGTTLDQEARERGTSVYFPRRVVPMLPPMLSEDLCSLVPDEDRAVLACQMTINRQGVLVDYRLTPALIRSQARLTYAEVEQILFSDSPPPSSRPHRVLNNLRALATVFTALAQARQDRGALEIDSREWKFQFANAQPTAIYPAERLRAHRLIEEAMIAANICAAKFLLAHRAPLLHRVHDKPDPLKIERLYETMIAHGITSAPLAPSNATIKPKMLAELLEKIRAVNLPAWESEALQTGVLRSLKQAQYAPDYGGHFGLGLSDYAHFTSPIRRYPDLLVHRSIWQVLARLNASAGKSAAKAPAILAKKDWRLLGAHCTLCERRADEASRSAVSYLKCLLSVPLIGKKIKGIITGITSFGIFVQLPPSMADGLLPTRTLGEHFNEYLEFNAQAQTLFAARHRQSFTVGDFINVRVVAVNPPLKKIDLLPD